MCRLQFSEPPGQPDGDRAGPSLLLGPHDEGAALEALLALGTDHGMDFELPGEAGSSLGTGYASTPSCGPSQHAAKDASRYHCPFPGCKRSFQELWRLKVHYRAPPNIRGSGKERGHGMRLTHCPKCGAALKVGGHHVKCAAAPKEAAGGGGASTTTRRGRNKAVRAEATDDAAAAAAYAESSYQHSETAPTAGTAAAAAASSRRHPYTQYGLSDMMQQEVGSSGQSLWQKALALHTAQQQQLQQQQPATEGYLEHLTAYQAGLCSATKHMPAAAAAALPERLHRLPSSDDSSSSRMVEGSCSAGSGSGNDTNWGPTSSSGYGSGSDDMDGQQQQQQQQPPLLALFGSQPAAAAAAAAAVLPQALKLEHVIPAHHQQQQQQQQDAQQPEAEQLLWQHMLLQHLQQHVQQTPGFSLPELIQVASALFGNRVDTLVNAFGLSGPSGSAGQQAQLTQLVATLRSTAGADA